MSQAETLLFERFAEVVFNPLAKPLEDGKRPEYGEGKVFNARVSFDLKKTRNSVANKGTIKLYNLNRDSVQSLKKKGLIKLNAGYKNKNGLIFLGDITDVETDKIKTETVTTIKVADGQSALSRTTIDLSFGPGVKNTEILSMVLDSFNLPKKYVEQITEFTYARGYCYQGSSKDLIEDLITKDEYKFSIQNGQMQIVSKDKATDAGPILLSSASGLIGRPSKTDKALKVRSVIIPGLEPGARVDLESSEYPDANGLHAIDSVQIVGDSFYSSPWYTDININVPR